jgi:NAD(P)-dependent dehydrogenase (short-subunit alcohol dehydrogenase family)
LQYKDTIVNTSSDAATKVFKGQATYAQAKHIVTGLSKSAVLCCAPQNISVNAVCEVRSFLKIMGFGLSALHKDGPLRRVPIQSGRRPFSL